MNDFANLAGLMHTALNLILVLVPSVFAIAVALWARSAHKLAKDSRKSYVKTKYASYYAQQERRNS